MTEDSVLKIRGLSKYFITRSMFRNRTILAVNNLDLEVTRGQIFGFLGPNGAGKTTTLNMIIGITEPTSGSIELFGRPFSSGNIESLKKIGYVPEMTSLPGYFTIAELLDFYAQLYGIAQCEKAERIRNLLEMVGLYGERHVLLENLSMGQLRLVDFIQALVNDPELILLDEPTVYLDPVIMERFRQILLYLKQKGKTILMSSHSLPEIERLSDNIAIINEGRLLKIGPKSDFLIRGSIEEEFLRIVKNAA